MSTRLTLAAFLILGFYHEGSANDIIAGIQISAALDRTTTDAESRVGLIVKLINKSQVTKTLALPLFASTLDVEIVDVERKREVTHTKYGQSLVARALRNPKGGTVQLNPGSEYTVQFALNRIFDLSLEGTYTIDSSVLVDVGGKWEAAHAKSLQLVVTETEDRPAKH